ncbi:hypothetical protein QBC36DRAFT_301323 [Triangularia setosa]|uniref:Transmembrane protein n=1 Tax=Triangularia setosa TaxID=2587417 RepID=A0AAN7A5L5_9PEZI|nr:hypothetical protein QBC36DRAFT_301323 [Podospora setosa]
MNPDYYSLYSPPGAQRRHGGGRMMCCLFTAGFLALCLAWVGFFGIAGQPVPFCCHTHYGYAVDGTNPSGLSTVTSAPGPMQHQVDFQPGLAKRNHADSGAVLPEPSYPPRVPNPQSERVSESYYDKSGQLVPMERKPEKNKIVVIPVPWGPWVLPIPWRPLPKKSKTGSVLPTMAIDSLLAFGEPSSPSPPSAAASTRAPTMDEAVRETTRQKHSGTGTGHQVSKWEARRRPDALWIKALDRWDQEEQLELSCLAQDGSSHNDDWFLEGQDMWVQYKDWFYAQARQDNFVHKREFMSAVLERYRLWVPESRLPEQCYPVMATKYTAWDMEKEFPCIVAIAHLQLLDPLHGVEGSDFDVLVPKADDDGGEFIAHVDSADRPPVMAARNAAKAASSEPDELIPLVFPIVYGDDDDKCILSCQFRINKSGNIEIRCPGLFSTDGKKFDQPEELNQERATTTRVPPVYYLVDHSPGPIIIPSNVHIKLSSPAASSIAPYKGQTTTPTPAKFPTGPGPVVLQPAPSSKHEPLESVVKTRMYCSSKAIVTPPAIMRSILNPLPTMSPAMPVISSALPSLSLSPLPSPTKQEEA